MVILAAWLLSAPALASQPFIVPVEMDEASLGKHLSYLEDPDESLTLAAVMSAELSHRFTQSEVDTPNFGFTGLRTWFVVTLSNPSKESLERLVEISQPTLDRIGIFIVSGDDGQLNVQLELGDHKPFAARPIQHRHFLVPIEMAPGESLKVVFRIDTEGPMRVPVSLWQPQAFFERDATESIAFGIYYGLMLVMAAYNLFVFASLRDRSYLYYVLIVVSYVIADAGMNGHSFQYLWPNHPWWAERQIVVATLICNVFLAAFSMRFLNLRTHHVRIWQLVAGLGFLAGVAAALAFVLPYHWAGQIAAVLALVGVPLYLFASWVRGENSSEARYLALGWLVFLGGIFLALLKTVGVLPSNFLTRHADSIGSAFFVVVLSLSLARRLKTLHEDNLRFQLEAAETLQGRVDVAIAELREQKEEAEVLRERAEQQSAQLKVLDQEKTHFFQNISHELRTPLTLMLNPLEDASADYLQDERISVALRNSRRLLRLVNQLLDFQKVGAGKKELVLEPIDLRAFMEMCAEYVQSACDAKSITFHVSCDGQQLDSMTQAIWVNAEVDALEKIIFNFLSNALKYTPSGGDVELGMFRVGDHVRLFVADTGPGISEEGQTKLFQVFSQVDQSTTRAYEGTGLGLALVKSLVEEMGGEVGVESAVGEGSSFWADFPMCPPVKPLADVLLVDEEAGELAQLQQTLDDSGCFGLVCRAHHEAEARAMFDQQPVRCVVVRHHVGGIDGVRVLEAVARRHPESRRVLVTDQGAGQEVQRAVNEGWVHQVYYLPVEGDMLRGALERFVAASPMKSPTGLGDSFKVKPWLMATRTEYDSSDNIQPDRIEVAQDAPRVMVVDDIVDMRKLVTSVLNKRGYAVVSASNGREALDLARTHPPQLIVTDWMMPEMSGPELISAIRDDEALAGTPVVLLTAKSDEDSKISGKDVGADAFLGKPFNAQELGTTVRNLLQLKQNEESLRIANAELRKTSERELRHAKNLVTQSEKLAQLGAMVASIGHEIANPVMLVSMSSDNVTRVLSRLEEQLMPIFTGSDDALKVGVMFQKLIQDIRDTTETTRAGATKLQELSMALRTQSRMEAEATSGVGLNEVVKESMVLAGGRTKVHHVEEKLADLPAITCYRSKVGQVVTNLLANAADALTEKAQSMAQGEPAFNGRIIVASATRELDGRTGVVLSIADNGHGVPVSIREKIFEQFFTTKPAGVGTGLGLAMCADIVREHGGLLSVDDDPELGGARFEMWLPLDANQAIKQH